MILVFVACTIVLAAAALALVLAPLYQARSPAAPVAPLDSGAHPEQDGAAGAAAAVRSLHELELDFQIGHLAAADYQALRAQYTRQALTLLGAAPAPGTVQTAPSIRTSETAQIAELEREVMALRVRRREAQRTGRDAGRSRKDHSPGVTGRIDRRADRGVTRGRRR